MKITILTSAHPRYDIRIFVKEAQSLLEAGFAVNLVVADGKGDETKNGVHILDVGVKSNNRFHRMTRTVGRVYERAVTTKADIYHLHDPELLTLVPRLIKRGKVIYDAHEDLPRQMLSKHWIPRPFRPLLAAFFERVENHYARQTTGIIGATPFITKRFERIHHNVCNINNYPLLEEFEDIEQSPMKDKIVCYVGAISSIRGLYEMVQAMEDVDGKLLLAGTFGNLREREIATSLPGWEKVVELGYCDRAEIRKIFSRSKAGMVVLHPTVNYVDSLPIKLFEYMAAGLPVIASDFPLWREIVETSGCGVCVDPLDVQAMAKAISWFFDNQELAVLLGKNGKRAVEDLYNWKREKERFVEFYSQEHHISLS